MGSYDIRIYPPTPPTPPKKISFKSSNAKKVFPYLDGPLIHFPVLADVKDLMLLCRGWNRWWEKFGLFHIVCKAV